MTPEEVQRADKLLIKMKTESEPGRPAGYVPDGCLKSFYDLITTPFVELIIYRWSEDNDTIEYLFQDRHDENWNGFCAHGGRVQVGFPASPVEIAQKVIDREFKGMGIGVEKLQVVSFLNWQEHPWCHPFAVPCLVTVNGDIPEDGRRWITLQDMPKDMIMNHDAYLRQCECFLRYGPLEFTPEDPDGTKVLRQIELAI